jgi:hypothetical protein
MSAPQGLRHPRARRWDKEDPVLVHLQLAVLAQSISHNAKHENRTPALPPWHTPKFKCLKAEKKTYPFFQSDKHFFEIQFLQHAKEIV